MSRSNKRKTSLGRVLLTVIITALFVLFAILGIKYLMNTVLNKDSTSENETSSEETTETAESSSNVNIDVADYVVYKDTAGDLGFNFVVADLKFTTTSDNLYYDLNGLVTSDGKIELGQTDYYYSQLDKFDYDLSVAGLTRYYVKSDGQEAVATILIPYSNVSGELKVYYDTKVLKFDLTAPESAEELIKNRQTLDNVITDDETDKSLTVSASYSSDHMMKDGVDYDEASTVTIYTYQINVASIGNNVKVENAVFIKDGSSYEYEALDSSYSSLTSQNIIGKTLKAGDSYALFFRVYRNGDDVINYNGVLRIKFSDSNDWVEIPTTIK